MSADSISKLTFASVAHCTVVGGQKMNHSEVCINVTSFRFSCKKRPKSFTYKNSSHALHSYIASLKLAVGRCCLTVNSLLIQLRDYNVVYKMTC